MNISDTRKEKIRQRVAESSLTKTLVAVDSAISEADKLSADAEDTIQAMESSVGLGVNLPDLEHQFALANIPLAKEVITDAIKMAHASKSSSESGGDGHTHGGEVSAETANSPQR